MSAPGPVDRVKVETPTIFEDGKPGRRALALPSAGVPAKPLEALLPGTLLRKRAAELPELGELQVVRHFTRLSKKNFAIDAQFYPLGSCTMKYNPRMNEAVAALPGLADIHPYQAEEDVQGALQVFWELEEMLRAITGLPGVTLQPAAGAHGEHTGLMLVRAWHRERGDARRTKVLIPDSAHGTNPASAVLAGFDTLPIRTAPDGGVDMKDLEARLDGSVAALMITNPSTLGLFERNIKRIAEMLHAAGALLYMDGANMNALIGHIRPGDFGVDVMHMNMHKTLSTPHGGGGPGSGPVCVAERLVPYLPVPRVARRADGSFHLDSAHPKSIGKVKAFYGHAGMVWRAYAYLRAHSREELRGIARMSVLNANYILARLKGRYDLPYEGPCMHEVVLSGRRQKAQGARTLDIAKRLLDFGYHPPTIYFPLIVEEALMIEPTETETRETLDRFCEAMLAIADEAERAPETLRGAPHAMPVRRMDEVTAAKSPIVRWRRPEGAPGAGAAPVEKSPGTRLAGAGRAG
jgi:glycine dehydrogenase subunit 2